MNPSWRQHAACRGADVHLFYLELGVTRPQQRHPAKRICAACPVREPCLEAGLNDHHGVWGGTTPSERRRIRRQRKQPTVIPAHAP